jgi:hypothetical protein
VSTYASKEYLDSSHFALKIKDKVLTIIKEVLFCFDASDLKKEKQVVG